MVDIRPGELRGRSGRKERAKRRRMVKYGGEIGVRFGGGNGDAEHS